MGVKAVIFDLDGVLVDSEARFYRRAIPETVLHTIGVSIGQDDYTKFFWGKTTEAGVESLIRSDLVPEEKRGQHNHLLEAILEVERTANWKDIPLSDGVLEAIKKISHQVVPMGLVTGVTAEVLEHYPDLLLELLPKMGIVITGDMLQRSKPDPEGYLKAAKELGVHPDEVLIIEDSVSGIKAGLAAGCHVVQVNGPDLKMANFYYPTFYDWYLDLDKFFREA